MTRECSNSHQWRPLCGGILCSKGALAACTMLKTRRVRASTCTQKIPPPPAWQTNFGRRTRTQCMFKCSLCEGADIPVYSANPGADRPSGKAQIAKQLQSVKARQQSGREDLRAALMNFMCRTSRRGAATPALSDENGIAESPIALTGRPGKSRAGVCSDERMRCCDPSFDFG